MKSLISMFCLATAFAFCGTASACDECHKHKHKHHNETVIVEPVRSDEGYPVPAAYETREFRYEHDSDCDSCRRSCDDCSDQNWDWGNKWAQANYHS